MWPYDWHPSPHVPHKSRLQKFINRLAVAEVLFEFHKALSTGITAANVFRFFLVSFFIIVCFIDFMANINIMIGIRNRDNSDLRIN